MYFILNNRLPITDQVSDELKTFDSLDDARKYCDKYLNFWEICKILEGWD
jgi:hypothetical protein